MPLNAEYIPQAACHVEDRARRPRRFRDGFEPRGACCAESGGRSPSPRAFTERQAKRHR